MSLRPHDPPHDAPRSIVAHHTVVDAACRYYGLRGLTVWRTVKAIAQLLVIAVGAWGAVTGALDPAFAFVVMAIVYIGAEGVETVLAATGRRLARERDAQLRPNGHGEDGHGTDGARNTPERGENGDE